MSLMKLIGRPILTICAIAFVAFGFSAGNPKVFAAPSTEIDTLNAQIKEQQDKVKDYDALIKATQSNISNHRNDEQNLENEIALLENQIAEKQLRISRTQAEVEQIGLEISLVTKEIDVHEERVLKQKDLVASLIRRIQVEDETTPIDALLETGTLSDAFARFEETRRIGRDLEMSLERVKEEKATLESQKLAKIDKQTSLESARRKLKEDMLSLESQMNFKTSLVAETRDREQEYQRILYDLRQQQQATSSDIAELEEKLKQQLESVDEVLEGGSAIVSWPLSPANGITAIFHDPTYPFRSVFEHPGLDIRSSVGTEVRTAAGGYVAWNKTGRMYGNYTMVVHSGGLATVYAHLSKFKAKPDTFVERGDVIGLSGGMPGQPGAGLSTGPHLHFEVRKDGIPVDPEHYLPQFPSSYYDYYDEYKALKIRL
jgi:murein DD-endopeptidase MepM/ murein hydrolase activator NlpD